MTLKQIFWTPTTKVESHTFFYYQTNSEIWWCVPSLFRFCGLTGSPSKVFQKYGMGKITKKAFGEFQPLKSFLSKQTFFISSETTLEFLSKWQEKEKTLDSKTFALLRKTLESPQGSLVDQRVKITKKILTNVSSTSNSSPNRSPYHQTLITMIRTSLMFSLSAQELLCENRPVTLNDIELFNEYISQLQDYVADLPVQLPSVRNDFIDIEAK